eukprot:scaffold95346_cov66-Phaeocystis_antarctica.AAC.6
MRSESGSSCSIFRQSSALAMLGFLAPRPSRVGDLLLLYRELLLEKNKLAAVNFGFIYTLPRSQKALSRVALQCASSRPRAPSTPLCPGRAGPICHRGSRRARAAPHSLSWLSSCTTLDTVKLR